MLPNTTTKLARATTPTNAITTTAMIQLRECLLLKITGATAMLGACWSRSCSCAHRISSQSSGDLDGTWSGCDARISCGVVLECKGCGTCFLAISLGLNLISSAFVSFLQMHTLRSPPPTQRAGCWTVPHWFRCRLPRQETTMILLAGQALYGLADCWACAGLDAIWSQKASSDFSVRTARRRMKNWVT